MRTKRGADAEEDQIDLATDLMVDLANAMRLADRLRYPGDMRPMVLCSLLAGCLLCGCGSSVALDRAQGGGGAGGTGTGNTSSSSSSGVGGAGGFDPSSSSGSSSSSSGTLVACPITLDEINYFVEVNGDGPMQLLVDGCSEPNAYVAFGGGGECGYPGAWLSACGPGAQPQLTMFAPNLLGAGSSDQVDVNYTSNDGSHYHAQNGSLQLDQVGEPGAEASGSYQATVLDGVTGDTLTLSGDAVLCRMPDLPPCP